jgi:intracellular septation protein A
LDIAGPLVVFQLCRSVGISDVWSLVISGIPPTVGVAIDWARWRSIEVVGLVVLGGIALSLLLALVTNDSKMVLLEGAAITAAFGVGCLVSTGRRRPLIFYFSQAFYGGRHTAAGAELDADYEADAEARLYWRIVSIVWGIAYLLEAAARAVIVQQVSTGVAITMNRTVPLVISGLLVTWMIWWGNRLRARKPAA